MKSNEYNARPLVYTPSRRVRAERAAAAQRQRNLAHLHRIAKASGVE